MAERGAGKPKVGAAAKAVAFALPAVVVLLWLFWAQLSATLGPVLTPVLGPMLPRPDGAPSTARAVWSAEYGAVWTDCREAAAGHVSAEWRKGSGFYRAWIAPGRSCANPTDDDSPSALRLTPHGRPNLALAAGTASNDRDAQREACDAALARGLSDYAAVARGVAATEPGDDMAGVLNRFAAKAAELRWSRPAGRVNDIQLCTLRDEAPPKPGELPPYIALDMGVG